MIIKIFNLYSKTKNNFNYYNKYFKKKNRFYEIPYSKIFSRKISFFPEFLKLNFKPEILKKKKTIKDKKRINNLKNIFLSFYITTFLKKFFFTSKTFPHFLMIYNKWLIFSFQFSFLIIGISILFSHIFNFSKTYEKNLIAFFYFHLIFFIETFFFSSSKNITKYLFFSIGNFLVIFNFWCKEKNFPENTTNGITKVRILTREIRCFITAFALLRLTCESKLFNFFTSKENLDFFFFDKYFIFSTKIFIEFFNNLFFFKMGGKFFFTSSVVFFLYNETFAYRYLEKKKLKSLMYFFFIFRKKFLILNYIFDTSKIFFNNTSLLIIQQNQYKRKDDLIIQNYLINNLDLKKNNSWNIKKKGINVPFILSLWNNEFSFTKKKMKWEIKTKKKFL